MSRRRAVRALAAAVVVTVGLEGCSNDRGPRPQSAADAPARSTTTTAPPPPVLERLAVDAAVFGGDGDQRLVAVAAGVAPALGRRLVAVGSSGEQPGAWWSADGRSWQRATLPEEGPGGDVRLDDVAADPIGGGWSAVGADGGRAAAWVSADGQTWTRAEVDDGPPMTTVAPTGLGLVSLGAGPDGAAAWQSYSGERWVRSVDAPDVFARPGPQRVVDVVAADPGVQALVERQAGEVEVWRSDDGVVWSVAPTGSGALPGTGAPRAAAAMALGATTVVVGSDVKDDGVDASMWLSDGSPAFAQVGHVEGVHGGDGDQSMTALAQDGDRLVVVGDETDEHGDLDAVVWVSSPAGGLERTLDEGPAVPGDQHVTGVARLGEVAVAVGWEETPEGVDAVAWTVSTAPGDGDGDGDDEVGAGLGWVRVSGQEALGGAGEQAMEAVVASGEGWAAVGSTSPDGVDAEGAVWRSSDGFAWATVPGEGLGGPGDQRLLDVAAGPGGLVAVGHDGESAAVWTSVGGEAWERVAHEEAVFGGAGDQRLEAVASVPGEGGGWVAVGSDGGAGEGDAAVWTSADGRSWARVDGDEGLGGPGFQSALDVVAGPGGLTAAGASDGSAVAWTSADGRSWAREPLLGGVAASGVALQPDGGVVAVGTAAADGIDAVAWRRPAGSGWRSEERDRLAGPLDQEMTAVAVGGDLAVAVGRTNLGGGDDAAAWSSTGGGPWARSPHDEDRFGGDQAQRMLDVTVSGASAVAVGWSGSSPASRDASVWVVDLRGGGARANL